MEDQDAHIESVHPQSVKGLRSYLGQRMFLASKSDVIAVGVIILVTLFLLYETFNMSPPILPGYPGDSFFPRLIITCILICAIPLFIARLRDFMRERISKVEDETEKIDFDILALIAILGLSLAYPLLLPLIGFEIATFFLLTILFLSRFEDFVKADSLTAALLTRSMLKATILSFTTMCLLYFVFVILLSVSMPVAIFPKYIELGI